MKEIEQQRAQLVSALAGKGAHVEFDRSVARFPFELQSRQPEHAPHTAWQLLEHMRITQADILDFCRNPDYKELKWPDDYWPHSTAPASPADWDHSVAAFRRDLQAIQDLMADAKSDLFSPIPHGEGQTLFREALLVIDHNSYHLGQMVTLRHLLGIWPPAE